MTAKGKKECNLPPQVASIEEAKSTSSRIDKLLAAKIDEIRTKKKVCTY